MDNVTVLLLVLIFAFKHFVVDFLWQTPYQFKHKHILGHPGGLIHARLHGFVSYVILGIGFGFFAPTVVGVVIAEMILHYFIDYFKMNINLYFRWNANNDKYFWYLLGLDQFCHYLTYVFMIWVFV